jgi:hypothetical protein
MFMCRLFAGFFRPNMDGRGNFALRLRKNVLAWDVRNGIGVHGTCVHFVGVDVLGLHVNSVHSIGMQEGHA